MSAFVRLLLVLLPWRVRRPLLELCYGYRLHRASHVGLAWVFPRELVLERGARIGHLTVVKGLERVTLAEHSSIGRLNWITAFPRGTSSRHFAHLPDRKPELLVGEHAAITHRHIIDCTERVTVGRFTTVAGFRSQILTHSIDLERNRQHAEPVSIGDYCFVGTACTILGGSALPSHSVLGAHSLLNKAHTEPYRLYGGVPAMRLRELGAGTEYFRREQGFVE